MSIATAPITVPEDLLVFWPHWNVGRLRYFRRQRRTSGTARLVPWEHGHFESSLDHLKAQVDPSLGGRWVPAGRYVKLEIQDQEGDWIAFMSDTPDELADHADVLLNAEGRVLIHGLGLGCVLNCLVNKSEVEHIDVVEVNSDVIELVAPFYQGKPVTFHHGDCAEMNWPQGTRWNYVWHDIWSSISVRNLSDDSEAEHGISYARLHRMFARRSDRQGSWGFEQARWMRNCERREDRLIANWTREYNRASYARRLEMVFEVTAGIVPLETWKEHVPQMPELHDRYKKLARSPISLGEAQVILEEYAQRKVRMGMSKQVSTLILHP